VQESAALKSLRLRLLNKLIRLAVTSAEPQIAKEAFRGLSVVCDMLTEEEFRLARDALIELGRKMTGATRRLASSDERSLVVFSPKSVVLAEYVQEPEALTRLTASGTFPPLLECMFKFHQRSAAEAGFSSLEHLVEAVIESAADSATLLPPSLLSPVNSFSHTTTDNCHSALLSVQSLSSVAISIAASTTLTSCLSHSTCCFLPHPLILLNTLPSSSFRYNSLDIRSCLSM